MATGTDPIEARRRLAQALLSQSLSPGAGPQVIQNSVGTFSTGPNYADAISRIVQAYVGGKEMKEVEKLEAQKQSEKQRFLSQLIAGQQMGEPTGQPMAQPMAQPAAQQPPQGLLGGAASLDPGAGGGAPGQQPPGLLGGALPTPPAPPGAIATGGPGALQTRGSSGQMISAISAAASDDPEIARIGQILLQASLTKDSAGGKTFGPVEVDQTTGRRWQRDSAGQIHWVDPDPSKGVTVNNNMGSSDPYGKKALETLAQGNAEKDLALRAGRDSAVAMRSFADNVEDLMNSGTVSGPLAGPAIWLGTFAKSLGMDVDMNALAASKAMQSELSSQIADLLKDSSVGRTMTDKDAELILNSFPQIKDSPETRTKILARIRSKAAAAEKQWEDRLKVLAKQKNPRDQAYYKELSGLPPPVYDRPYQRKAPKMTGFGANPQQRR